MPPPTERRSKTCFFVAPIGEEGSETRIRSNKVLKHLVRKALEPDYAVERADQSNQPGTITVHVVQTVFDADLVVADLSGKNANVFYELAIRHVTKKPSIPIVNAGERIPFDVGQIRAVEFDLTDPDSMDDAVTRLREQAAALHSGEEVLTPVQFAQMIQAARAGTTNEKLIIELLQRISESVSKLQTDLAPVKDEAVVHRIARGLGGIGGTMGVSGKISIPSDAYYKLGELAKAVKPKSSGDGLEIAPSDDEN